MPKIEPVYEPRGQQDAFDGGEDEYEEEDEGSRLPLLIVIGLLVLAAFGGVVWLAYQHGVERGMKDAPRVVAGADTQTPSPAYDKIYQKPAPADQDSANDDTAPPPPTPTFKPQAAAAAPSTPTTSQSTAVTPAPATNTTAVPAPATKTTATVPAPNTPTKSTKVAAKPAAPPPVPASVQPQATRPPAKLVVDTKPAPVASKPVDLPPPPGTPPPSTPAPSTPAPAATAASGDYVLQIGSYKSEDEASSSWKAYKARHAIAAAHAESIKQVDLGAKGTWYRLRIGGFASKDEATSFCAKLKASGGDCIPAKN